jgi:PAS domain S-box-containing protein
MTGRGSSVTEKRDWRLFFGCLRTVISLAVLSVLPLSATSQPKTVLAIYSEQRLLPSMRQLDTALRDGLAVETNPSLTYLSEYLDFGRFGGPAYDKLVSDFLRNKYSGQSIDAIVAVGPLALPFLYRHREDLFPGIPVVFLGVTREAVQAQALPPNFVGVPVSVEPVPTIRLALSLQPDAREIVIVTGTSEYDRAWEAAWRRDLPQLQTYVPIRYLTGLALDDVLRQLSHLPANTIVYFSTFFRDGAGRTYIPARALRQMADVSTAPIYGSYSTYVGVGIVGGYVFEIEDVGRQATGLVQKILNGEKVARQDLPAMVPSHYLVDWRQLQRWHLAESRLPAGTVVRYRELGPWQLYRQYIIAGIALILVETLLILGLLWQRAKRREVEKNLRISNDRFRLAVESGKSVGWEWDLKTGRDSWFGDLQTMFGIPSDLFVDRSEDFYRYVHQEDRQSVAKAVADAKQSRGTYAAEFRVVRVDGTVRWVTGIGKFYYGSKGEPERMLGIATDITERKCAEAAARESEDKLRLLLDSTAEAIYGLDLEGRCTFCNPACLRLLKYERVDELLGKNMHTLIHYSREDGTVYPEKECRAFQAFRSGQEVHVDDEVLWRANGTSFPAEYWAYPERRGQEVVGAVVTFIDITQRRSTEAALTNVNRRLIEAQEQERTRIARELHDDIGQRLALFTNELEQLRQDSSDSPIEVRTRMGDLQRQTAELANDVQSLSHKLHSSKLKYLGLAAAIRSFCKEFGEQQELEIDFKSHEPPITLSPETSLCLFRVLQEALHNAAKHSGVRHFEVQLWETGDQVHLTVSDSGTGFDSEAVKESPGLGLISMEERLKMLKGALSIESHPKRGTTIHASVPLSSKSDPIRSTG